MKNLTHYLEFLENSSIFWNLDAQDRRDLLAELRELSSARAYFVPNTKDFELSCRINKALFSRLYSDILDNFISQAFLRDFAVISVFSPDKNLSQPKELKSALKAKNVGICYAYGRGKDYKLNDFFGLSFLVFDRSDSFNLRSFADDFAKKYSNGVYGFARSGEHFSFCCGDKEVKLRPNGKQVNITHILKNFKTDHAYTHTNREFCLDAFRSVLPYPHGSVYYELGANRVLFYIATCYKILEQNRELIGSITGHTARSLWHDRYDRNAYFRA